MSEKSENTIETREDFRLFIARILLGSVFLVFGVMMSLQQLPYQYADQNSLLFLGNKISGLLSVASSCLVIAAFFIPNQYLAISATIFLYLFNLSYLGTEGEIYYSFIWWVPILPLCFSAERAIYILKRYKWFIPLFAMVDAYNNGLHVTAIPIYTLYFIPFLPFNRLFVSFNSHFEPR
ncbi:hypothetical protein [Sediminibacterium sp.]|uniref:hypothetical protein n=1 Tax=Sediminibacterium sp. TaxID=1917865 RepID=UPI003F69F2EA